MVEQAMHTDKPWPLIAFTVATIILVGLMLLLSYYLGERHQERTTGETYESGIKATGEARLRFPVHFYIIAMFFVIFDLEAVFLIAWAIAFQEVGWMGYWGAFIFIMILLAVLVYEWKTGALEFGPKGKQILKAYHQTKDKNL